MSNVQPAGSAETRESVDFDIHAPEYAERTTGYEAQVRSKCPVAWTESYGGHWLISGHHAVGAGLRDRNRFTAEKYIDENGQLKGGITIPTAEGYRALPNESDPPEWDGYRKLVSRPFSPLAVDERRDRIAEFADEVIDHMIEAGEADFVMQVGSPVTALITLDILGLPLADWRFYAERIHQTFSGVPGGGESEAGIPGIQKRLSETIAARRAQPETGVLDDLIASDIDGRPTTDEEVKDLIYDILVGGFDTTAGLMAGALRYLQDKPEIKARLVDDTDFLRTATEEFLRWVSPAVGLAKSATQDFELEGQSIKAGDKMWFMYRAANWDPAEFDDPAEPDLERSPNRHYAFGAGIHRCLGSNLARAIFQTVVPRFLERIPDYTVDADNTHNYAFACVNAGFSELRIRYTPGRKVRSERILEAL
ncbi:cytochrome P450 [Nocardia jinanensis]|uniref:Cytochrome P450 n=1 Tax=Nocardia jinanensis TaxID=382504 RepID=A0A917RJK8_9NOCA|nr:cytochrome P450 [Nocardia jinanensis]GGL11474.1 cytochrome P450 [Nocardia jinanensis]